VCRACINCIISDARRGNNMVVRAAQRHPDRFFGVAFVTPRYGRVTWVVAGRSRTEYHDVGALIGRRERPGTV
jgi:predicted TIM-barrel fold metal-dependent hydrolase